MSDKPTKDYVEPAKPGTLIEIPEAKLFGCQVCLIVDENNFLTKEWIKENGAKWYKDLWYAWTHNIPREFVFGDKK